MKKLLFVSLVMFSLNACLLPPKYREGISDGSNLQLNKISSTASQSSNITDFVSKVYTETRKITHTGKGGFSNDYITVTDSYSNSLPIKTDDLPIYEAYSQAKGGILYKWKPFLANFLDNSNAVFFINEVGGNVESALKYRWWWSQGSYGYGVDYITKNGIDEYISSASKIYVNNNKMFSIVSYLPERYILKVFFENKEKAPVVIDLNEAKLVYNAAEYGVKFDQDIKTNRFSWRSLKFNDFEENSDRSKVKLNPGQKIEGQIGFEVKGLNANDLTGASLSLGNVKVEGLNLVVEYEINKERFDLKKDGGL